MSKHMIRVCIGSDTSKMTLQDANDALDTWVANHSEWIDDTSPHQLREVNTESDGSGVVYWNGICRFYLSDEKDNLLTKCEDKLVNKCDWYRLGYHNCDHDESDRRGCSWDDEREWTDKNESIPPEVPDFL